MSRMLVVLKANVTTRVALHCASVTTTLLDRSAINVRKDTRTIPNVSQSNHAVTAVLGISIHSSARVCAPVIFLAHGVKSVHQDMVALDA